jgi:hypothetical protein
MVVVKNSTGEEYWDAFELQSSDVEFLYNYLLELETPLTSQELIAALVDERIRRQKLDLERQRTSGGDLYRPKDQYQLYQKLILPAFNWQHGEVTAVREGHNPELGEFTVIKVALEDGSTRELAAGLPSHKLNDPPKMMDDTGLLDKATVLKVYQEDLVAVLEDELESNPDFVRIAARWFPRALLIDINVGHLNIAEAVLDMAGGGPLSTDALIEQVGLTADVNLKLVEFSLDLALQEDARFDEVGPSGDVLWYLRRLEPPEVLEPPLYLRYAGIEHDRSIMTKEMLALEQALDDELSPLSAKASALDDVEVCLIFPHWRSGTLPLSARVRHLFPTAYEAPRIRFILVDGDTGEKFPGWVVREKRYVFGLQAWYEKRGVMPGSTIRVRKGSQPGEVIIQTETRRSSREWIRTVLVGSDGGVVFAMLKQAVSASYEDRMAIAIPDKEALDQVWQRNQRDQANLEKLIVTTLRETAKLNPQSHVHASELYAAINVLRRCPPAPILSILASRPTFTHVGDLHFRLSSLDHD